MIIVIYIYHFCLLSSTIEDDFQKKYHKNDNSLKSHPVIKISFEDKKDKKFIKDNIYYNNIFEKCNNINPYITLNKKKILSNESNLMKFIFKKKKIIILCNHYYLGGDTFQYLKSYLLYQNKTNVLNPNLSIKSALFIPKFIMDYYIFTNTNIQKLPKINSIKRYNETLITKNKQNYNIYKVMKILYKSLDLQRPMKILLPYSFDKIKKINNNVGIILFIFNGNETYKEFNDKFENNKYMIHTSNFILKYNLHKLFSFNNKNTNIRDNIDCVISCFYSNIEDHCYPNLNYSINWTTKIMPIEPVYTSVYTIIKNKKMITNVTYTVSTSKFKKNKNMKYYKLY